MKLVPYRMELGMKLVLYRMELGMLGKMSWNMMPA